MRLKTSIAAIIIVAAPQLAKSQVFPEPNFVQKQTWFWEKIYGEYGNAVYVIYDERNPEIILDILDFDAIENGYTFSKAKREKWVSSYLQRYKNAIQKYKHMQNRAENLNPLTQRINKVYRRNPEALKKLYLGKTSLRWQQGVSDAFERAFDRGQRYYGPISKILKSYQLPEDLVALVFVESMFVEEANSNVGALGIWQLMPETASHFMKVNPFTDERRSPLKSTHAASKILRQNMNMFNHWGFAITAYNHGPSGLRRAQESFGTAQFGEIIEYYRGGGFGFDSRNFYAKFLSSRKVFRKLVNQDGIDQTNFLSIKLTQPMTLRHLSYTMNIPLDEILAYNSCITDLGAKKFINQTLPLGYELLLPKNRPSQHVISRLSTGDNIYVY